MRMSVFSEPVSIVIQVVMMSALLYKWCKIAAVVKFEFLQW